jgi:hypothetical protein
MTIPRLIFELFSASYLTGPEIVDHSEIYDILVTGGYLNISKKILTKKDIEDNQLDYKKMMVEAFNNSDILAEGYNPLLITHGGVIIVKKEHSRLIAAKDEKIIEKEARNFLSKAKVRSSHFGVHYNNLYGTIKEPNEEEAIIIYTFCTYSEAPKRVLESTIKALKDEEERKKLQSKKSKIMSIQIDDLYEDDSYVELETSIEDYDLSKDSLLDSLLDDHQTKLSVVNTDIDDFEIDDLEGLLNAKKA